MLHGIKKKNGKYRFYRDPEIMKSRFADMYEESCNFSFDVYSKNIEPMINYVREKYPIEKYSLKIQRWKRKTYFQN